MHTSCWSYGSVSSTIKAVQSYIRGRSLPLSIKRMFLEYSFTISLINPQQIINASFTGLILIQALHSRIKYEIMKINDFLPFFYI